MEISPLNTNYYDFYSVDDISTDNQIIDNNQNISDEVTSVNELNGLEKTATAIAVNPIPPESIELQELQTEIVSEFEKLIEGNNQGGNNIQEESIQNLTSSLLETVQNSSQGGEVLNLSEYASVMDLVNKETQKPSINEQLQAYTQNLRY